MERDSPEPGRPGPPAGGPPAPGAPAAGPPRFRYVGPSALSVAGPRTGRRYRFEWPGDEVAVHPLDAPLLASVPNLRRL